MIRKIKSIDGFGIFHDFTWDESVPLFARYNFIYGWNYSGKTTLTRLLRSFERGGSHPDYTDASATVVMADGSQHEYGAHIRDQSTRVFNEDFVTDSIRWDEPEGMEPIFMIGEQNIQLEAELEKKRNDAQTARAEADTARNKRVAIESQLEALLTERARPIRNGWPGMSNFHKGDLRPIVQGIGPATAQLDKAQYKRALQTVMNTDRLDEVDLCQDVTLSEAEQPDGEGPDQAVRPQEVLARAANTLGVSVTVDAIDRLKDDPQLNEWVRQGLLLHKDKKLCQFCGERLRTDILGRYERHFSDEYTKHLADIEAAIAEVTHLLYDFRPLTPASVYRDLRTRFRACQEEVKESAGAWNLSLELLLREFREKQKDPLTPLHPPELPSAGRLQETICGLNAVMKEHNARTANFDTCREEAKQNLLNHVAGMFEVEHHYKAQIAEAGRLAQVTLDLTRQSNELQAECRTIEGRLSDSHLGAESINCYLQRFFGKDDIQISAKGKGKFDLLRKGTVAKNLSSGERTAISLAYFIAGLGERGSNLPETIVVVDDPISSLDANHLYNAYAMLKTELADVKQAFIFTHSFEFLNLLKQWVSDSREKHELKAGDVSYYLLQNADKPRLTKLPRLLRKFKSEYNYLFWLLYDYHCNPSDDHDRLYYLGNVARRFLETFCALTIPRTEGITGKLHRLGIDESKRLIIERFVNEYSHAAAGQTGIKYPDMGELSRVVDEIMGLVKGTHSLHYEALVEEATKR